MFVQLPFMRRKSQNKSGRQSCLHKGDSASSQVGIAVKIRKTVNSMIMILYLV